VTLLLCGQNEAFTLRAIKEFIGFLKTELEMKRLVQQRTQKNGYARQWDGAEARQGDFPRQEDSRHRKGSISVSSDHL